MPVSGRSACHFRTRSSFTVIRGVTQVPSPVRLRDDVCRTIASEWPAALRVISRFDFKYLNSSFNSEASHPPAASTMAAGVSLLENSGT
jgi:hypothetical protein